MGFLIGRTLTVMLRTPSVVDTPFALRAPDSTPTLTIRKNGSVSGLTTLPVLSSAISTGYYKATYDFTQAEWSDGDCYELAAAWTMESVACSQPLAQGWVEDQFYLSGSVNDASATTSSMVLSSAFSTTGDYVGSFLVFGSGTNQGEAREITGWTGGSRTATFTDLFPHAPANGDRCLLIGRA